MPRVPLSIDIPAETRRSLRSAAGSPSCCGRDYYMLRDYPTTSPLNDGGIDILPVTPAGEDTQNAFTSNAMQNFSSTNTGTSPPILPSPVPPQTPHDNGAAP
ncbi:hypothetical protein EV182_000326 [Spiromyces aspiralis]|uniref:Uncharacterized protein n=1 Tax=Spiromyces aspiralis TaxID=68401 RepID=A0ACC1I2C3_9FUNG|nr:hypothetical protein EV182_000326 [Spiromyces aspiralis]